MKLKEILLDRLIRNFVVRCTVAGFQKLMISSNKLTVQVLYVQLYLLVIITPDDRAAFADNVVAAQVINSKPQRSIRSESSSISKVLVLITMCLWVLLDCGILEIYNLLKIAFELMRCMQKVIDKYVGLEDKPSKVMIVIKIIL